MTLEEFNQHGWKATDKLILQDGRIGYPHAVYFNETPEIRILIEDNNQKYTIICFIYEIEFYKELNKV